MRHKVLAGLDAAKHIPWRGKQLLPEFLSALHSFLAFGDYSKDGENGGVLFSKAKVTAVTPSHSVWLEQWLQTTSTFVSCGSRGWVSTQEALSMALTSHATRLQCMVHGWPYFTFTQTPSWRPLSSSFSLEKVRTRKFTCQGHIAIGVEPRFQSSSVLDPTLITVVSTGDPEWEGKTFTIRLSSRVLPKAVEARNCLISTWKAEAADWSPGCRVVKTLSNCSTILTSSQQELNESLACKIWFLPNLVWSHLLVKVLFLVLDRMRVLTSIVLINVSCGRCEQMSTWVQYDSTEVYWACLQSMGEGSHAVVWAIPKQLHHC